MMSIFVLSLGVLVYIFVGYPLLLAVLAAIFGRNVKKGESLPSVSLVISAYNEEAHIREKLENSLSLDYPKEKLEIIVASESTDSTNEIVKGYEGRGIVLYAYQNREGKRATLYKTVPLAKGEIIVFSDANAMYDKAAIKNIVRNFNDDRIGCVSGRLRYTNPNDSAVGKGENAYWEHDLILKKMASRLFKLGGGVNGSIFAVRKELYRPIDKFRGDDYEISGRVEIDGYGVVLEPDAISYEETSKRSQQEFKRKIRLATWNLRSTVLLLKESLVKRRFLTSLIFFSHRFLRYTTPVWLMLLFTSNMFLEGAPAGIFLIIQISFYLAALLGLLMEKAGRKSNFIFLVPQYFCMVNCAALVALFKNIFGKNEMLWEKVR